MKKIIFLLFCFTAIALNAQTVYHYNVPCEKERYYQNESSLITVITNDSMIIVFQEFFNNLPVRSFGGFLNEDNKHLLTDEDSIKAELHFLESGEVSFAVIDSITREKDISVYSEVDISEMIPVDYLCYTAYRSISFDTDEGKDSVGLSIQRKLPVPASGVSEKDSLAFIMALSSSEKGLPHKFKYPEDRVKNADIMLIQDYTSMYESSGLEPNYSANWVVEEEANIVLNKNDLLCTVHSVFKYLGGAHPVFDKTCEVYDFKTNALVTVSDIFIEGFEQKLTEKINAIIREKYELSEKGELMGFFVKTIPYTENFALYSDCILFVYNAYELAPYSMGTIYIEIPFEELTEIIKKDGPIWRLMQ